MEARRRFLIFVLLGPLIGGWTLMLIFGASVQPGMVAKITNLPQALLRALPASYLIGFVPAVLTALIDHVLGSQRSKLAYVALCGFVFSATLPQSWAYGIAGFSGAVVCSWIANRTWREAESR